MSALAIAGAAALQGQDPLAEAVAEHGATAIGIALGVVSLILIGAGVGASLVARAAEERLLGERRAGPRVFLWTDVVLGLSLYLFGMVAGGVAIGITQGHPGTLDGDVEELLEEAARALEKGATGEGAGVGPDADPAGSGRAEPDAAQIGDGASDGAAVAPEGGGADSEPAGDADGEPEIDFVTAFTLTAAVMGLVAAYLLIAGLARKGGAAALGLRPRVEGAFPGARPITAVTRYVATLPFIFAAGALLQLGYLGAEGGPPQQAVAVDIAENLAAHPVFTILFAAVLIPILEEVIFRGFLLELFAAKIGPWGGVLVSSLIFAALHGWPAFGPILALALALGWIKLRSGSLYGPMLVHMLHNGSQVALAHLAAR